MQVDFRGDIGIEYYWWRSCEGDVCDDRARNHQNKWPSYTSVR